MKCINYVIVILFFCLSNVWSTNSSNIYPSLLSFDLDMGFGNMTLYFDSLVFAGSFNISRILLQSQKHSLNPNITVFDFPLLGTYNNVTKQGNSTTVKLYFKSEDYAILKSNNYLGHSINDTFLSIEQGAILSDIGNPCQSINSSFAIQATSVSKDSLPPFLSFYNLNMDDGYIELTFSEPMDPNSFQLEGLALQGSKNSKVTSKLLSQYVKLVNEGSSIDDVSNYNRTIKASLGMINLNSIKKQLGLATTKNTTWLSGWKSFVNDSSGNPISLVAFDYLHGVPPYNYKEDWNKPYLLYWDFNMNSGTFYLIFSEPVYISFFNYSGVVITNNNGTSIRLSNPVDTPTENTELVYITLSDSQRFDLQASSLYNHINTSYLILDQHIVVDTSRNQNYYESYLATEINPMPIHKYYPDTIRPELNSFNLDLVSYTLTFTFSEAIKLSSFHPNYIILQSDMNLHQGTEFIELKSSDVTLLTTVDSTSVVMLLSEELVLKIRLLFLLAKSKGTTFVSIHRKLVTDKAVDPNEVIDITTAKALQVSDLVPDAAQVLLNGWSIDWTSNIIVMNFSRPLELSTIDLSQAFLSSEKEILPFTKIKYLTNSTLLTTGAKGVSVRLAIEQADQEYIKLESSFCKSDQNCFLSFSSNFAKCLEFITDDGELTLINVNSMSFATPYPFIADETPPSLIYTSLDMNDRTVSLYLNEPVLGSLVNVSGISLANSTHNHHNNEFFLTNISFVREISGNYLTIQLCLTDYIKVQQTQSLGLTLNLTYFHVHNNTIQDSFGNFLSSSFKRADSLNVDSTSPSLIGVYLNPSLTNITLFFSELINTRVVKLAYLSFRANSGAYYSFKRAQVYSGQPSISNKLIIDLSNIRSALTQLDIATKQSSTFVFITNSSAIRDIAAIPNYVRLITSNLAIRDGINFIGFRLDMVNGILTLEASFYVKITSIDPTLFHLHSSSGSYTLTTSSSTFKQYSDGPIIQIYLSEVDKTIIQRSFDLSDPDLIYLVVDLYALTDENSKTNSQIISLSCSHIIPDYSIPTLSSYSIDLNSGLLTLEFSKEIVVSSIDLYGSIALSSLSTRLSDTVTFYNTILSDSTSTTTITNTLVLDMNYGSPLTDRELILQSYPLASYISRTFILIRKGLAYDNTILSIPSQAITLNSTFGPTSVTKDKTLPTLLTYSLDMDLRLLSLNFSEGINTSTIKINYFTFSSSTSDESAPRYTLTSSSQFIGSQYSSQIIIGLSSLDINNMMAQAPGLLLSSDITYLSILPYAFYDLAHPPNANEELYYRYGQSPKIFIPDQTPPLLLNYNISIEYGTIDMQFNEIVNCDSFNPTLLLFQPYIFTGVRRQHTIRLTNDTTCSQRKQYSTSLHILIGFDDWMLIKSTEETLKSYNSSYLRFEKGAIQDAFGNDNIEIVDGEAMLPNKFTPDTQQPRLLSYSVSSTKVMTLFFNEPVNISTLDVTKIYMQSDPSSNPYRQYHLTSTQLIRFNSWRTKLELVLKKDYQRITTDSLIFINQNNTYLRARNLTISDMAKNLLTEITINDPLIIAPSLIYWDLSLQSNSILFQFSGGVQSGFSLQGVIIQNAFSNATIKINLTTSSSSVHTLSDKVYRVYLSSFDLNSLKLSGMFVNESRPYSLFLTMNRGISVGNDPSNLLQNQDTLEIPSYRALSIRRFFPDTVSPSCYSFELNLNTGFLLLSMSEAIDVNQVNIEGFTLFSSIDGRFVQLISTSDIKTLVNQTYLSIKLAVSDLSTVKLAFREGIVLDSLIIQSGSIYDLSGNGIIANDYDHPILVSNIVEDTTPPSIISYSVDLSTYQFTVLFDEVVNPYVFENLTVVLYRFNDPSNYTDSLTLSNYTLKSYGGNQLESIIFDLHFLRIDQFALESIDLLYNSINDSFIGIFNVPDIFNNTAPLLFSQATTLVQNTERISLESFDFETSGATSTITMYFQQLINISNFDCSDFTFQSSSGNNPSTSVTLTKSDCTLVTTDNDRIVEFEAPASLFSGMGNSQSNTWMFVSSSMSNTLDVYGNKLVTTSKSTALRMGPRLIRVSVDMNTARVILIFSKDIDFSSFVNIDKLTFYSLFSKSTYSLSSSSGYQSPIFQSYGNAVQTSVAYFDIYDYDMLRLKPIKVRQNQLYLYLQDGAISDSLGNSVYPYTSNSKLYVDRVIEDDILPRLLNVTLDLSQGKFVLQFDEPIDSSSLLLSNFGFQTTSNTSIDNDNFYRLTGGDISFDIQTLTIILTRTDSSNLKVLPRFGDYLNSTYFNLEYSSIVDMSGNYLDSIPLNKARQIDTLIPDTVSPELSSFQFNISDPMDTTLTLNFTEPVSVSTINITSIVLQSRYNSKDGSFFRLTGGTVLSLDGDMIVIRLLYDDVIGLQLIPGLVRSRISTYLVIDSSFIEDVFGNKIVPYLDGYASLCSTYIDDVTPPYVVSSILDMQNGMITLQMSEPVVLKTVNVTAYSLYVAPSFNESISLKYTLSNETSVTLSDSLSFTIIMTLSSGDLNSIKSRYPLGSQLVASLMGFRPIFTADFVGNKILRANDISCFEFSSLIQDTVSPSLVDYQLNVEEGYIHLQFSESLNIPTVNLSEIKLQSTTMRRYGAYITLQQSTISFGTNQNTIYASILLDKNTLDYMKYSGIGQDDFSSYLSWSDRFAMDSAMNSIIPAWDGSVLNSEPLAPSLFEPDITTPELLRWYIDRTNMSLYMDFNEPIKLLNISALFISLANENNAPFYWLQSSHEALYRSNSSYNSSSNSTLYQNIEALTAIDIRYNDKTHKSVAIDIGNICPGGISIEYVVNILQQTSIYCPNNALDLYSFLRQKSTINSLNFVLFNEASAVEDYAKTPNYWSSRSLDEAIIEGSPVCGSCDEGEFIYANCTSASDRICKKCTSCSQGYYEMISCASYQDTSCSICSTCLYGQYITSPCSLTKDTQCEACTECPQPRQYSSRLCQNGFNTICDSCEQCEFSQVDQYAKNSCTKSEWYRRWKNENCCLDMEEKKYVLCKDMLKPFQKKSIEKNQK